MKHFRICSSCCCLEKIFAAIGAMASVGALMYLVWHKCGLCKNGCHFHGEIADGTGTPEMTMDLQVNPAENGENN